MSVSFANIKFTPTPASIPPRGVKLRTKALPNAPVNYQPLTPLTFLLHAALIYPDKVALVHPDVPHPVVYSNAVWAQRIQNLAYALIKAGISPSDRVAVIAPNSPLIADAHFGILAARAILVPINTRLKPHEVEYILEHSGARLILVDHECRHLVPATSKARVVISNDTGRSGDPYEEFLTEGRVFSGEKAWQGLDTEADENASAILCYTSGTTGRPKGVITTLRGSYLAAVANAFEGRITKDSTYLWILPMFHAAGWTYPWANVFAIATQITLRTVNYTHIWNHLLHSGVTHYCGAPTVQIGIVNDPLAKKLPSSRPVTAIVAGAAPTAHIIAELEKKGIHPVHVYGLTETYGPFTRNYDQAFWANLSLEDRSRLMARQGHAFATAEEVRVILQSESDTLEDVPADGKTLGEIVTRGNITMKEYFNDREATNKAFRGGYFRTGDLAVMHPDGSIAIMDRSKDIIISGGENASSLAIEQELATHPHVLEVSVIARNHVKWGERPMAFVILHPQHVEKWKGKQREFEADLKAHAKSRLPGFACPEWVEVVPELPKTSTGKILKTELRKVVAKL